VRMDRGGDVPGGTAYLRLAGIGEVVPGI
jgi:hypothetical protein